MVEAATGGDLWKKVFFKIFQNLQKNTCVGVSLLKKETPTQVFSCDFREIFKKTFFTEYLRALTSHWII